MTISAALQMLEKLPASLGRAASILTRCGPLNKSKMPAAAPRLPKQSADLQLVVATWRPQVFFSAL